MKVARAAAVLAVALLHTGCHWIFQMVFSKDGQTLYVVDRNNHRIRRIAMDTEQVSALAGTGQMGSDDGPGDQATFCRPEGIAIDGFGYLYVTEIGSEGTTGTACTVVPSNDCGNRVRRISPDRLVETIAGSGRGVPAQGEKGKRALEASFCEPTGIAVAPDGQIFVADTGNHVIRVLEP